LPEGWDRKNVSPITYVELIYLSGYRRWNTLKAVITRYPIADIGSTYVSDIYVRTTIVSERRRELGDNWEPLGEEYTALEYPLDDGAGFMDSMQVSTPRISRLGADYDGDTCSATFLYSDESLEEVNKFLNSRDAFVDPQGGFKTSTAINTVNLVLKNITG